jgi:myo-inositol-1(or 4)-monophosphatase
MNTFKQFGISLVKEAGQLAREKQKNILVSHKNADRRDLVTNIDIEVSAHIKDKIHEAFPEHNFYSEEGGNVMNHSGYTWVVDPIDGTSNYTRNIPHYASCVTLFKDVEVVVFAAYNPVTDECFWFDSEEGYGLNETYIQTSDVVELSQSFVNFHPGRKESNREWAAGLLDTLLRTALKSNNLGASALDICFLAAGRTDIVIYGSLTTLDIAGSIALLRAAGGEVYEYGTSNPVAFSQEPQKIIATNSIELLNDFYARVNSR